MHPHVHKCPSPDDWIMKMWYILHNIILLSHKKIMPFASTWMELETHPEWSKSERERQIPHDITNIWNLRYGTNEPFHRKKNHGFGEQTCGCQGEEERVGCDWNLGLIGANYCLWNWISNEILLYSTGNYV